MGYYQLGALVAARQSAQVWPPAIETEFPVARAADGAITDQVDLDGSYRIYANMARLRPAASPHSPLGFVVGGAAVPPLEGLYQPSMRNDEFRLHDGYDASRDIVGMAVNEGKTDQPYHVSVDLANVKPGAWAGHLDMYLLVGTGADGQHGLPDGLKGEAKPWQAAAAIYDPNLTRGLTRDMKPWDGLIRKVSFDALQNRVDVDLDKNALHSIGWKDGQPLTLQALTSCDFTGQVTDDVSTPGHKPWQQNGVLTGAVNTAEAPKPVSQTDWASRIVYFEMTDRFKDGDPTNNQDVQKGNLRRFQGGDLAGLISQMDYLKSIGTTALWVSPPMKNQISEDDPQNGPSDGYHGYWTTDYFSVDPHLGTMEQFKQMVAEAHQRGMKVVLDLPLNDVAWQHPFVQDPKKNDWFHHIGDIKDWNDQYQVENGSFAGLPDLAQENPEVAKYLIDVGNFWANAGVDGFRLDAVRHVPHGFWRQFSDAMHTAHGPDFLLLGEVLHGNVGYVANYQQDGVESLFDYPLYYAILDTFAHGGSCNELGDRLAQEAQTFDDPDRLSVFLDNHDMNRFLTEAGGNRDKLKLALSFAMTINRIPTVYYGTEQAMDGPTEFGTSDHQPLNRKMMAFDQDPDMKAFFQKLTEVRNTQPALQTGAFLEAWKDNDCYAYTRALGDQAVFVALNNSGNAQSRTIPIPPGAPLENGRRLRDALSGREFTVQDGKLKVDLPPRAPLILIPE